MARSGGHAGDALQRIEILDTVGPVVLEQAGRLGDRAGVAGLCLVCIHRALIELEPEFLTDDGEKTVMQTGCEQRRIMLPDADTLTDSIFRQAPLGLSWFVPDWHMLD